MSKLFMTSGAFFGFLAVILGSYSAHALRGKITVDELNSFDTAVRYQMFHALALMFFILGGREGGSENREISFRLFFS